MNVKDILKKKKSKQKITMLTAYDYPFAKLLDRCGIDIILVGDSLANVVLGLKSTKDVGMQEMIHHTKAVRRAVKNSLLVGDMPFESYQADPKAAVRNAKRFIEEAGCDAVKVEWFDQCLDVTERIVKSGIPVMGHVGLTPQTADQLGGMKLQGKDAQAAKNIVEQAKALQKKGCFSIVLECVPDKVAGLITGSLTIPTIGIGAGPSCDGQVLVLHDLLGLFDDYRPKFVKQFTQLNEQIVDAVKQYREEVEKGQYPDNSHSFSMNPAEWEKLKSIFEKK